MLWYFETVRKNYSPFEILVIKYCRFILKSAKLTVPETQISTKMTSQGLWRTCVNTQYTLCVFLQSPEGWKLVHKIYTFLTEQRGKVAVHSAQCTLTVSFLSLVIPDLHHIFQKVLIKHIYFRIKRLNVFKKNFSENHLKSEKKNNLYNLKMLKKISIS